MANGDFSILVCFAVAQASFTTLIAKSGRKRQIYRQAPFDDKIASLANWRRQRSGNTETISRPVIWEQFSLGRVGQVKAS